MGGEAPRGVPSSYPTFAEKPVGQKIANLYRDRLRQFTATGQYQGQNLVAYVLFMPLLCLLRGCQSSIPFHTTSIEKQLCG